jgi:dephospho-CoA kinase
MIIGLTGPIGSGQSTVAKLLASKGAVVVDADQIGRDLLDSDAAIKKRLIRSFGESVVSAKGTIDRSALARMAFRSTAARAKLNKIVHPALIKEIRCQTKSAVGQNKVAVIDAALLLEWGMDRGVDLVIVVGAPKKLRLERLVSRGVTRADALRRMKQQASVRDFHKAADVFIGNSGTKYDLRKAVAFLWPQISRSKNIR